MSFLRMSPSPPLLEDNEPIASTSARVPPGARRVLPQGRAERIPLCLVYRSRHGLSGGQIALRHIDRGGWPDSRQGPGQFEGAARKPLRRQGTGRRFGTGIH